MEPKKCLRCRSARLEPCAFQSTGRIYVRPANTSFWSFKTGDVPVDANVCLDCGTVDLVADVKKAAALVGRAPPN
jgi:ferredoxin-like protein FixX